MSEMMYCAQYAHFLYAWNTDMIYYSFHNVNYTVTGNSALGTTSPQCYSHDITFHFKCDKKKKTGSNISHDFKHLFLDSLFDQTVFKQIKFKIQNNPPLMCNRMRSCDYCLKQILE